MVGCEVSAFEIYITRLESLIFKRVLPFLVQIYLVSFSLLYFRHALNTFLFSFVRFSFT